MTTKVEQLNRRWDNLPITAAIQMALCREGHDVIEEVIHTWIAQDPLVRAAYEANEDNIMRAMAAPIESAIFGTTTVELRKARSDDQSLLNAHPARDFGELKSRLKHLNEDIAEAVGSVQDMSGSEQSLLQGVYEEISARMTVKTEELQITLGRDGPGSFTPD